ncbi:MAG: hypothetical protein AAGG44_19440, partial [Planctomycetota bacterium]
MSQSIVRTGLLVAFAGLSILSQAALRADEPVKVFILAGQSNMQGHAKVSTMQAISKDPATKSLYEELVDSDGEPRVADNVWITSIGSSPEVKSGRLSV